MDRHDSGLADVLDEVRRIEIQARRLVTGVMAGSYLSVFRGSGIEFDEVREYEAGDPERSVDWNVTARMGRPFVKTFVDERELTVLFLLDLSASMNGGFGTLSARQTAARVCACLGLSAVRHGDRVGLIAFSEGVDAFVAPRGGVGHALRVVRDCLVLEGSSEQTSLVPALELAASAVRRHAIVFVVSDFLSDGWKDALAMCGRRHDVIAVRLLTPELAPRAVGLVRLRNPETGVAAVIDASSKRSRAAYARTVAAWRVKTERAIRRARIDLMDVPVPRVARPDAVAGPILRFFRMRQQRRVGR